MGDRRTRGRGQWLVRGFAGMGASACAFGLGSVVVFCIFHFAIYLITDLKYLIIKSLIEHLLLRKYLGYFSRLASHWKHKLYEEFWVLDKSSEHHRPRGLCGTSLFPGLKLRSGLERWRAFLKSEIKVLV